MMWDGMAQGRVTGGVDEDDVGRNGTRACDWMADGDDVGRNGKRACDWRADEDDVGRKGTRACDWMADGTRMRRAGRTEKERIRRLFGRMRSLSD